MHRIVEHDSRMSEHKAERPAAANERVDQAHGQVPQTVLPEKYIPLKICTTIHNIVQDPQLFHHIFQELCSFLAEAKA